MPESTSPPGPTSIASPRARAWSRLSDSAPQPKYFWATQTWTWPLVSQCQASGSGSTATTLVRWGVIAAGLVMSALFFAKT